MSEEIETLDRIFKDAAAVDMNEPASRVWIMRRAIPIVELQHGQEQVNNVRKLCEVLHIDAMELAAVMLGVMMYA